MDGSKILAEELEALKNDILLRHEAAGQKATGETAALFSTEVENTIGRLFGPRYAGVLERGRKPGKVPYNFVDILKRWAAAKGISFSSDKELERWANAVKWKIIREGTSLYRSGSTEDIFTTATEEFKERLIKRLTPFYAIEITNLIFKQK